MARWRARAVVVLVATLAGCAFGGAVDLGAGRDDGAQVDAPLSCSGAGPMASVSEVDAGATGLPATPELAVVDTLRAEGSPLAAAVPTDLVTGVPPEGGTGFAAASIDDAILVTYQEDGRTMGRFWVEPLNDGWVAPRFTACLDALHPPGG